MQPLVRAYDAAVMGLAGIGGLIIAAIFISIVIDVLVRTAGLQPPAFTLTYVEYGLLYFSMCCAPYLVRVRGHVFIESFVSILPLRIRHRLAKVVYFACCASALLFAYESVILFWEAWDTDRIDVRGVDIPMYLLFLPMPFGYLFVAIEFLRYLRGPDSMYSYDLSEVKDSM